jgi:magnesium chelatase accessory protein
VSSGAGVSARPARRPVRRTPRAARPPALAGAGTWPAQGFGADGIRAGCAVVDPVASLAARAPLDWDRDGTDWPNREVSRFVEAAGLRWHVQQAGQGPSVLLVHGTGSATHSWAGLLPLLAGKFSVIAPDLPGHGFTSAPSWSGFALPAMAAALAHLLDRLDVRPQIVVGHSAGAAILARMVLDARVEPKGMISLAGALLPLHGWAGLVFSPAARLMSLNPLVPRLFAWRARDEAAVRRLIDGTGSRLDARTISRYARLVRSPAHVAGALAMMANWDLRALARELPRLAIPLVLVNGTRDLTLPAGESRRTGAVLPAARRIELDGLGHLAHEERPDLIADLVTECALQWRVPARGAGGHD